ncbi:hypothetical protein BU26DRAFT_161284 [Trematosphaeria pertusa]|uniref:Uncharacterized protein n=1 Tax=Trematosphaeria pertusa TaxID=390896 RepID=A0A6A6HYK3_9PLEO|nr:uncharacterized protein BU26DRAFT_161284 [Trematosphaeria pertusa]KAF2242440.1 hypothetical protein BU26DRAFT_161284 [Trematosphaeria pertusa]
MANMPPTNLWKLLKCTSCNQPADRSVFGEPIDPPYTGRLRGLCQKCRLNRICQIWHNVHEWRDILMLNLAYLRREVDCSPGYGVELNSETNGLVPGLIRLHEYGILSCSSQPGGVDPDGGFQIAEPEGEAEGWYQARQRAYVELLIPTTHIRIGKEKVSALVNELLARTDIVVTVYSEMDTYPTPRKREDWRAREVAPVPPPSFQQYVSGSSQHQANQDDKLYYFRSSMPPKEYVVTEERMAPTQEALSAMEWKGKTRMSTASVRDLQRDGRLNSICGEDEKGRWFDAVSRMRPLAVLVASKDWSGDVDLLKLVEDVCVRVGLPKVFQGIKYWRLRGIGDWMFEGEEEQAGIDWADVQIG